MASRTSPMLVKQNAARTREFLKAIKPPEDPDVARERSREHVPSASEAKKLFFSYHRYLRKARKKNGLYVPSLDDALAMRADMIRRDKVILPDQRAKALKPRHVISDKAGREERTGMGHDVRKWLGIA